VISPSGRGLGVSPRNTYQGGWVGNVRLLWHFVLGDDGFNKRMIVSPMS